MRLKKQLLLTICSLCCFMALTQNFYPPIVNYSIKDYGKDRNPENFCVIQDHRGVMYFGTSHGVHEFDGEKWNFIQAGFGAFTRSLALDSSGVIYVGTYDDFGLLAPDSTGGLKFVSLRSDLPENLFFSNVWRIHATQQFVYFQAEEVLITYDIQTKKTNYLIPSTSFHTSFLINNELYLRQREVGLVKKVKDELIQLKGSEIFANYGVFGLHEIEGDSLLIITQELGVFKWSNNQIKVLPDQNPLPTHEWGIYGSIRLRDGTFALNTLTKGVLVIDKNANLIRKIDRSVGIRSDVVHAIFQDRDLNLWLALENGISKVNYHSPLSYFDDKTGIEGNVEAIIRYKDKLYVGTSYGLFVQDQDAFGARIFKNTRVLKGQVWDFEIVDDILYVASANGVLATKDGLNYQQTTDVNSTTLIFHPIKDYFIVGGADGIFIFNKDFDVIWSHNQSFSTFLGGELDPNDVNTIWLGTTASGALRIIDKGNKTFKLDQYGDFDGLLDGMGKPILYGDSLIFGAKDGLYYFVHEDIMKAELKEQLTEEELNDPDLVKGIFETYELKDSLFTGQFLLLEKGIDRTWYCNEFKVGYYDENTKSFINRPFWGIDYGRINKFYLEDNGVFWIGAAEGLIRYQQNDFKRYHSDFSALIRQVKLIKGDVLFNGVHPGAKDKSTGLQRQSDVPAIHYALNDVQFSFSAPYFEDEHQPEYRFLLEGYDDDWSNWNLKSEVSYNNLDEGNYQFKVEAKNIYGQISRMATYSFTVLPPWYRTGWAYLLYGFAFLFVLFLGVKISSMRLKSKNLWLEGVVEERTSEISQKNIVLEHQKKEIEDSINYAQRIQEAILPLEEQMKKWLPNSFVLFRPKDIVSGDFYWFLARENKLIIICADCTGHGVPGAFMSMIGSDRLNNIVSEKKITSPAQILSELNQAIKKSLKQDGQKNATRDGMDAAVCTVDLNKKTLYYAGANRPLWIFNEHNELTEIKATKVAVAGFTPENQVYEEHEIPLSLDMKFYMTTDGYADQFGGEFDKKYKVKNMKNFIRKIANENFVVQGQLLEKELLNWMGNTEQVDDICVVGFKIGEKVLNEQNEVENKL